MVIKKKREHSQRYIITTLSIKLAVLIIFYLWLCFTLVTTAMQMFCKVHYEDKEIWKINSTNLLYRQSRYIPLKSGDYMYCYQRGLGNLGIFIPSDFYLLTKNNKNNSSRMRDIFGDIIIRDYGNKEQIYVIEGVDYNESSEVKGIIIKHTYCSSGYKEAYTYEKSLIEKMQKLPDMCDTSLVDKDSKINGNFAIGLCYSDYPIGEKMDLDYDIVYYNDDYSWAIRYRDTGATYKITDEEVLDFIRSAR